MQISANTTLRRIIEGAPLGTGPDNVKGSLWIMSSNDTAAVVEVAGYLDAARTQLRKGDRIMSVLDMDGTMAAKDYVVAAIAASAPYVTIAVV